MIERLQKIQTENVARVPITQSPFIQSLNEKGKAASSRHIPKG
jgi:hypothetical protein